MRKNYLIMGNVFCVAAGVGVFLGLAAPDNVTHANAATMVLIFVALGLSNLLVYHFGEFQK